MCLITVTIFYCATLANFFMYDPVKWLCNTSTYKRKSDFFYVLTVDQDTIDLRPVKMTIIMKSVIGDLSLQCASVHGSVVSRPFALFWSVYHDAIYSTVFFKYQLIALFIYLIKHTLKYVRLIH